MLKRSGAALAALALSVAATVPAYAIDVTDAVTEIESGAAPIALIGGAVLVILAGVKLWKLVRRAM